MQLPQLLLHIGKISFSVVTGDITEKESVSFCDIELNNVFCCRFSQPPSSLLKSSSRRLALMLMNFSMVQNFFFSVVCLELFEKPDFYRYFACHAYIGNFIAEKFDVLHISPYWDTPVGT